MSITFLTEFTSSIPAPRLFKAAIVDWDNLATKILADKVVSVETIEGDGGVGSVRQVNFIPTPGMLFSSEQRRLDFKDAQNCEIKSSVVGGGGLGVIFESASYHVKIEPSGTGSVAKMASTYTPMPGANGVHFESMIKAVFAEIMKGCEEYLLDNPDACN